MIKEEKKVFKKKLEESLFSAIESIVTANLGAIPKKISKEIREAAKSLSRKVYVQKKSLLEQADKKLKKGNKIKVKLHKNVEQKINPLTTKSPNSVEKLKGAKTTS